MSHPSYKTSAKTDPCGAKLESFYHGAHSDYELLENKKKDAMTKFNDISRW